MLNRLGLPSLSRIGRIAVLAFSIMFDQQIVQADDSIKKLILPGESFLVEGRPAFILISPQQPASGPKPWIFYAPTLNGLPDEHEKWMHEKFLAAGIAVAGIDVGEGYGSPASRKLMSAFYQELTTKRGFAAKTCMLGRSRGGLWVSSWAIENPDKVSGLAGIYPVFDFRSYPGIKNAAPAYGLTPDQLSERQAEFNPIERVSQLAVAKIPVCIIHGDVDQIVPITINSEALAAQYQAAGVPELVKLIVPKGQGHNFWEGFFRNPEIIEFAIERARQGAVGQKPQASQ